MATPKVQAIYVGMDVGGLFQKTAGAHKKSINALAGLVNSQSGKWNFNQNGWTLGACLGHWWKVEPRISLGLHVSGSFDFSSGKNSFNAETLTPGPGGSTQKGIAVETTVGDFSRRGTLGLWGEIAFYLHENWKVVPKIGFLSFFSNFKTHQINSAGTVINIIPKSKILLGGGIGLGVAYTIMKDIDISVDYQYQSFAAVTQEYINSTGAIEISNRVTPTYHGVMVGVRYTL